MSEQHLGPAGPSQPRVFGRPPSTRSVRSGRSVASRPPPALRLGPTSRSLRAHTHVTLVIAHGDVPPPPSAFPQRAASAVEEALSRQLDRDTAGQHLSLRSRRSSAATLASMRTDYAANLEPATEEDESSRPGSGMITAEAGPSRRHSSVVPSPPNELERGQEHATLAPPPVTPPRRPSVPSRENTPSRRVNPKESSAWLRWSSPAPSFPKKGLDKGKGRAEPPDVPDIPDDNEGVARPTTRVTALAPAAEIIPQGARARSAHSARSTSSALASPHPTSGHSHRTQSATTPTQPFQPPPSRPQSTAAATAPQRQTHSPTCDANKTKTTGPAAKEPHSHPPPPDLHASTSSTLRDEGEVSAILPAEPDRGTMDVDEPPAASGKPDPSLEVPPPARGWRIPFWSSDPLPATPQNDKAGTPDTKTKSDTTEIAASETPVPVPQPPAQALPTQGSPKDAHATESLSKTNGSAASDSGTMSAKRRKLDEPSKPNARSVASTQATAPAKTPARAATAPEPAPEPPAPASAPPTIAPTTVLTDTSAAADTDETPKDTKASSDQRALVPATQSLGWGAYFASFVYTVEPPPTTTAPPPEASKSPKDDQKGDGSTTGDKDTAAMDKSAPVQSTTAKDTTAQSTSKTTAAEPPAPPVLAPPIPLDQPISPPSMSQSTPQPSHASPTADTTPNPSPPQSKLAASTSSSGAGGWLSYLAFRANQKRITSSTLASDEACKSREAKEEIMDFSADPDFPSGDVAKPGDAPAPSNASQQLQKTDPKSKGKAMETKAKPAAKTMDKTSKAAEKPADKTADIKETKADKAASVAASDSKAVSSKQVVHKKSQNLAPVARRQSNASSVRSAGSAAPPSPRATSSTKANSALPPPPQAPSKQPNLIIPSFETTYDRPPRSLMPRTAQDGVTATAWRALSYVVGSSNKDPPGETRGLKEGRDVGANLPRRIGLGGVGSPDDGWKNVRRVVVVGVHGWFPAKLLNSVIGEPTGTSVKFANMMGEAVKQFFKEKGVDNSEIRLTLIPLEGEGVIDDRVDKLYKAYLSNPAWINDLRRADAVLFAAHSQGCIVTTHLISRMIAQGHIRTAHNRDAVARCEWAFGPIAIVPSEDSKKGRKLAAGLSGAEGGRQKVGMLAMCGVHLGPFLSISTSSVIGPYLTWFENAAARELFEFQDTQSAVSQAYQRSLAMILDNEVRVLLLASLNDQVVPIYGASFFSATHPLLLRALFVDGASYSASDFMTNLICFAFMLRNAGIDDQRLVEHLSEATAGSLTGVGHSTPYEELGCYSLAVQYLFYSGPAAQPLPPLEVEPFAARDARNDFELPWIMRALVDAPEVKDLFPHELRDLKESIHAWKPTTKPLKEIKKRLEPMAGRPSRKATAASTGTAASISSATGSVVGKPPAKTQAQAAHLRPSPSSTSISSMDGPPQPSPHKKVRPPAANRWADQQALGTRR